MTDVTEPTEPIDVGARTAATPEESPGSPPTSADDPSQRPSRSGWRPWRRYGSFEEERFDSELAALKIQLDCRAAVGGPSHACAVRHHDKAKEHRSRGRFSSAWASLKAAQRELIDMFDQTELKLEEDRVRAESTVKLKEWRAAAIASALELTPTISGDGKAVTTAPEARLAERRTRLKFARQVLDDHLDNVYRKFEILKDHVYGAALALVVVLSLTVLMLAIPGSVDLARPVFTDARLVVTVMLLGAVGAALSGVITPLTSETAQRIPAALAQSQLVWVRPFVGAGSALVVVAILRANVGGIEIEPGAVPVAALAAGFSERLVGRSVASVSEALGK